MNKTINNIKQKSKNNTNCIVRLIDDENEEIEIEISLDLVLKFQLKKNEIISDEIFEKIINEQKLIDAKQTAFNYASYAPRTKKQITEKLKSKKFSTVEIEQALIFLENFDLINDEKFAEFFIKNYFLKKKVGKLKIKNDLINKGISKEIATEAISKFFPNEKAIEFAMTVADKKMRLLKKQPQEKQKQSLYNHLINKGFTFDEIKNVMSEIFR